MHSRLRRAATLGLACAGLLACNAIVGLDRDYEVAAGVVEAGSPEASDDGATPAQGDGGIVGPDGSTPLEGGAASFCQDAGSAVFCDDFEDGPTASPYGWEYEENVMDPNVPDAGSTAIVAGAGVKGTRALRVRVNAGPESRKVALWKAMGPTLAQRYTVDFDFKIEDRTLAYVVLGGLAFPQSSGGMPFYGLAAYQPGGGGLAKLDVSTPPGTQSGLAVDATQGWHHATVTLERQDGGSRYARKLEVDGLEVDGNLEIDARTPIGVELRLGAFFTSLNGGTIQVDFDDVLVRRQ